MVGKRDALSKEESVKKAETSAEGKGMTHCSTGLKLTEERLSLSDPMDRVP